MMKTLGPTALAVLLFAAPADAQRAGVDLDHVFIADSRDGAAESKHAALTARP